MSAKLAITCLVLSVGGISSGLMLARRQPTTPASAPTAGSVHDAAGTEPPGSPDFSRTLEGQALTDRGLQNPSAYVPPQCYTQTRDGQGKAHNPCFTCHIRGRAPDYLDDSDLQLSYGFAAPVRKNPWTNLFVDRRADIASVSDEEMLAYVRTSNYFAQDGSLSLANRLRNLPPEWDEDGDGRFRGYVPDAYFQFDAQGFDRDPAGVPTGWRAFAYAPVPGTFWPTNGSAGDVLIRLPEPYRQTETQTFDDAVYAINLAIVQALITREDVPIDPVSERAYGVDLDQDGKLTTARRVKFLPMPTGTRAMHYVGAAKALQETGKARALRGLFPEGTEFLHSVRYLDVVAGRVTMAARMKELRYAKKVLFQSQLALEEQTAAETKEKDDFPDRLRTLLGSFETGLDAGRGFRLQAFIEDARGELRPQTFEETAFCVGCHGGVGATVDSMFSFARKLSANVPQHGWFHWSQHDLTGMAEPVRRDGRPEYALYLAENGAGDEFRSNEEVQTRFFDEHGKPRAEALAALRADISTLLVPSPQRALALDKAYLAIVREQSFRFGRDAVLSPLENVHHELAEDEPTGLEVPISPAWATSLVP